VIFVIAIPFSPEMFILGELANEVKPENPKKTRKTTSDLWRQGSPIA
jgi:hypothetical protein